MINNQLKNIDKKSLIRRKNTFEKKNRSQIGFVGLPGSWDNRVFAHPGLLPYQNWSSYWVDPPGRSEFNNFDGTLPHY
jgi:hypothetical protein